MEGIQTTIKYTGPEDSIGVIKVGGYIDTTTSSELERSLGSLLKKNQYRIIVDLGDVDYISSAGWGIFISEIKGIKENNGDLKLARMIPEVYEVFELLEFHYILKAYDTVEEAVDSFIKEGGGILATARPREAAAKETLVTQPQPVTAKPSKTSVVQEIEEEKAQEKVREEDLTVDDHIRAAVAKYPNIGAWQLKKILKTEEYSFTNIGWFELRRRLKMLGLSSKDSRMKYSAEQD
jgi:anti-sigma B factor antagonist